MKKDTNFRTWRAFAPWACKHPAFTLAELLMAVLVISIIMTALAPVITRRAYDNVSIKVNKKKGLEIYTNPGTYTFDVPVGINTLFLQGSGGGGGGGGANYVSKTIVFNENDEDVIWTVPMGVNRITFTIIGPGGGGGGGYGKTKSDSCESGSRRIPAVADDGKDLCVTNVAPRKSAPWYSVVKCGEECNENGCCWKDCPSGLYHTTVCTREAANIWCDYAPGQEPALYPFPSYDYNANPEMRIRRPRLMSLSEMKRVDGTKYMGSAGIDACWSPWAGICDNTQSAYVPQCTWTSGPCKGASSNQCIPFGFHLKDGHSYFYGIYGIYNVIDTNKPTRAILCVRSLDNWDAYGGAGGQSGAMIKNKTISVLPGDVLKITVPKGGAGGRAGTSGGGGGYSAIEHLRNNVRYKDPTNTSNTGYYYAYGGYGGLKATSAGNGAVNDTINKGCSHPSECQNAASSNSGKGSPGNGVSGGAGAGGTRGGSLDSGDGANGVGFKAGSPGYGGGGGSCARGVQTASSCAKGGDGGNGQVTITFNIMLPGAGGGAATNVGGSKVVGGKTIQQELKYTVQEGSRIVFKVGTGGAGGTGSQDGINGTATVIGNNQIIFLAGEKGKTVTTAQKNSLLRCIDSTTSTTVINNCTQDYKAAVGRGSYINQSGNTYTTTDGIFVANGVKVLKTIPGAIYKGGDGKPGSQKGSAAPWTYGFDGGPGGIPFGMTTSSNLIAAITCGGGIQGTSMTGLNYICTSGSRNANDAKPHDPVNNEFGGGGGGGGGIVDNSTTAGEGGAGSSGYLRIRWDESEQE